jgi:hypothetical protein
MWRCGRAVACAHHLAATLFPQPSRLSMFVFTKLNTGRHYHTGDMTWCLGSTHPILRGTPNFTGFSCRKAPQIGPLGMHAVEAEPGQTVHPRAI